MEDARELTATEFPSSTPPHWLLPFLIGTMPKGKLRILDFGGGGGLDYVYASKLSSRGNDLDYHVVDLPAACEAGREIADLPVIFHLHLPPVDRHFDIIVRHVAGIAKTVAPRRQPVFRLPRWVLLSRISTPHRIATDSPDSTFFRIGSKYILICKTSIHSGPQFVRAQTNIGGRTPIWVFKLSNIDAALPNYEREYRAKSDDLYHMDNYPEESRVPWMTNALYAPRDG